MATKLKGLHVKKVDFVDEGANQRVKTEQKKQQIQKSVCLSVF